MTGALTDALTDSYSIRLHTQTDMHSLPYLTCSVDVFSWGGVGASAPLHMIMPSECIWITVASNTSVT